MLIQLIRLVGLALYDVKYQSFSLKGADIFEEYNKLKNGKSICIWDKHIRCLFHYSNGYKHGKGIFFHSNGKINCIRYYVNDCVNSFTSYYSNGRIWKTKKMNGDKLHGLSCTYDKRGKLIKQSYYFNDKLHGKKTVFYKNGTSKETVYIHGKPDYIYYREKAKAKRQTARK